MVGAVSRSRRSRVISSSGWFVKEVRKKIRDKTTGIMIRKSAVNVGTLEEDAHSLRQWAVGSRSGHRSG